MVDVKVKEMIVDLINKIPRGRVFTSHRILTAIKKEVYIEKEQSILRSIVMELKRRKDVEYLEKRNRILYKKV